MSDPTRQRVGAWSITAYVNQASSPAHNILYTSDSDPAGRRPRTCRSLRTPHRQSRPRSIPDSCGKKSGPVSLPSPLVEALLSFLPAGAIVLHRAVVFAEEAALSVVDWQSANGGGHSLHIPYRSGQRRLGLIRPGLRVLQLRPNATQDGAAVGTTVILPSAA